jgi:YHS domain-containing protein
MFVRVLLVLLILFLVLRVLWRFIYSVAEGAATPRRGSSIPGVRMVKDPVCGTYIVPTKALTTGSGDDLQYFCSEKCRQAYRSR